MKKSIFTSILFFTILISGKASNFVFGGQLPALANQTLKLQYLQTPFQTNIDELEITLDEKGNFKTKTIFMEAQLLSILLGDKQIKFYAEPNDSLFLKVKKDHDTERFIFYGKGAVEANFILTQTAYFLSSMENPSFSLNLLNEMTGRNPESFKLYCDSISMLRTNYLKNNAAKLSPKFIHWQTAENIYEYENLKINYPVWYYSMRGINDKQLNVDSSYYFFLKNTPINNDNYIGSNQYRTFLNYYLINRFVVSKTPLTVLEAYKSSREFYQGKVLSTFQLGLWNEIIAFGNFNDATFLYNQIKRDFSKEPYFKLIEAKYLEKLPLERGAVAPDFKLPKVEGGTASLSDYRGKVVYIDFWASWCGPCKAEIPASEELKKQYAGKDIVFINISIDDNPDSWRKGVNSYSISGINLLARGADRAQIAPYKVATIPMYYIIGKDGKLLYSPAMRPSNSGIRQQLEEGLK